MSDEKKNSKDESNDDVVGLDEPAGEEKLRLVSAEHDPFIVPKKVALQSELVKTMVEGGTSTFSTLPCLCSSATFLGSECVSR